MSVTRYPGHDPDAATAKLNWQDWNTRFDAPCREVQVSGRPQAEPKAMLEPKASLSIGKIERKKKFAEKSTKTQAVRNIAEKGE